MDGADNSGFDTVILHSPTNITNVGNLEIFTAAEVTWPSDSNVFYQVQWASELDTNTWNSIGGPILGNGSTSSILDSARGSSNKFYRVLRLE